MPQTESERVRCGHAGSGWQQRAELTGEHGAVAEEPWPPLHKSSSEDQGRQPARPPLGQHRPSVLRQTAHRRPHEAGPAQSISLFKAELDPGGGHRRSSSPPPCDPDPGHAHPSPPPRRASPKHGSVTSKHYDGPSLPPPGGVGALFLNGACRWPGCDAVFEETHSFLKHLHSDHGPGDKSTAQWRLQRDLVQFTESQLTVEKQKLFAMQLHLHHFHNKSANTRAGPDWPYGLALVVPQARAADGAGAPRGAAEEPAVALAHAQHGFWPAGAAHLLPDLAPSIECYKYNNIRPPYTYACLIRWSIQESPDQQRTLNDIYNWFTTMFYYYRHNTATWKNAVRHNLSLHKCFVRVDRGKGAVWTVDEAEYQRRKGQKLYRDHPVKWMTPYSIFHPEEP